MRVIITGGTGLVGRALAVSLVADGHEVIALTRNPSRPTALPAGVRLEAWDARSAAGWAHLAEGADAIVNVAGENLAGGRWTHARKERIRQSRFNAGQAVVQAVEQATHKPRVVIQGSAVGYYGARGAEVVTEDDPPGDDFLAMVCVEWEASTAAVESLGVRRAVTRTGLVFGRDATLLNLWALPFRFFVGGPLGNGRQYVPWVHVADEVGAIRFLIANEAARGPFNLCAPETLTNRQFSRAIAHALYRPNLMRVPGLALRLVLGEMAQLLLSGQRVVPARLEGLGFTFRYPTAAGALADLLA